MLESINLSLSSTCGADCLFCPIDRGQGIRQKLMPFEYVEKIINEISSENFRKHHQVSRITVGENGDAFLNKDLIKILRFIKTKLPQVKIDLSTNFQNFTKDKVDIILREKLIDLFSCNVDGSNSQNYFEMKKLDYDNFKANLMYFLSIRKKLNYYPPLTISVITLNRYLKTIYYNFNVYPIKLKNKNLVNTNDDFSIIEKQLKKVINLETDKIIKIGIFGWAEREQVKNKTIDYKKYSCRNISRIEKEAFIAPDGTWYACCFDSNNELALGNVIEKSIDEIYGSKKKYQLAKMLKAKQFGKIGGPCKTVNCCQRLPENRSDEIMMKLNKLRNESLYKFKKTLKSILPKT